MQKVLKYAMAGLVVLGVLLFITTYTVRYNESAVVMLFGRADEGSVKSEPGLYFRLPYPIQSVVKYDRRVQFVETVPETRQTADNRQVIVQAYMTWRVKDPLKFLRRYGEGPAGPDSVSHFNRAREALRGSLRAALAEVSRYRMSDLLSTSVEGSRLPQLEADILAFLRGEGAAAGSQLADLLEQSGVEPLTVGIAGLKLPESVSKTVIERVKATREAIAAEALNRGKSIAETTKARAEADANKILAFVEAQSAIIRARGDAEAAPFYERQRAIVDGRADSTLAVFLKMIEALREGYGQRTTVVMPLSAPGMGVFRLDVMKELEQGRIPAFMPSGTWDQPRGGPGAAPGAPSKGGAQ